MFKCKHFTCTNIDSDEDGTLRNPNTKKWKLSDDGKHFVTKNRQELRADRNKRLEECRDSQSERIASIQYSNDGNSRGLKTRTQKIKDLEQIQKDIDLLTDQLQYGSQLYTEATEDEKNIKNNENAVTDENADTDENEDTEATEDEKIILEQKVETIKKDIEKEKKKKKKKKKRKVIVYIIINKIYIIKKFYIYNLYEK